MLLAPIAQRALAAAPLAPIGRPEVQVARELRARVGEHLVLAARRVGIDAVLARIDDAERAAMTSPSRNASLRFATTSSRATRGSTGSRAMSSPSFVSAVRRPWRREVQELISVGDRLRGRRVDERKLVDRPEPERLEPQQHAREPRAQDLGLGEHRPRREVVLRIQAHANARRQPAATARALNRVRLRDRLDA